MNWLLYEDKIIALDKFNTILNPIMIFIVIVLLILIIILFNNYVEHYKTGISILNVKQKYLLKLLLVVVLIIIILVGITNILQHYLEVLMRFDGYMYINYSKEIIEI